MQRVKRSTAVAVQPAPPVGGAPGYFAQPNPQGGVPATVPGFEWYNNVQEELVGLVLAAGLALADNDPTQLVQAIIKKGLQGSYFNIGTAGGTADAITATYTPAIAALSNGMTLYVRAASANATTTPTFTPASGTIPAKQIIKGAGSALSVGDIAGGGHWIELQYDLALDKWVLLNPAYGVIKTSMGVYSGIAQYNVNTTLTAANIGQVIAVGAGGGTMTLPLLSATRAGDSILLFCQGGTASIQPQGADTLYGGSSLLASLTFKGNEYVEVTNFGTSWGITGGSWLASALGVNQTWQNVAGSRAVGTTYTNTTGRPIEVKASFGLVSGNGLQLNVGGIAVGHISGNSATVIYEDLSAVVPQNTSYSITYFSGSSSAMQAWAELRT